MTHEVQMWHHVYTKPALYSEIPLVLHLALCCFVKVLLEATAETIGSVVNQNGRKFMYSLRPSSLSNEVQVAWNGPAEFSRATDEIIKTLIDKYFENFQTSVRFYVKTSLKIMSGAVKEYFNRPSKINLYMFFDVRMLVFVMVFHRYFISL